MECRNTTNSNLSTKYITEHGSITKNKTSLNSLIIRNNLSLYSHSNEQFLKNQINRLIFQKRCHLSSNYKSVICQLLDENEYINNIYERKEIFDLLPKVLDYYKLFSLNLPKLICLLNPNSPIKINHQWKRKKQEEAEFGIENESLSINEINDNTQQNRKFSSNINSHKSSLDSHFNSPFSNFKNYNKAAENNKTNDISISMIKLQSNKCSRTNNSLSLFPSKISDNKNDQGAPNEYKNLKYNTENNKKPFLNKTLKISTTRQNKNNEIKESKEAKDNKKGFKTALYNEAKPMITSKSKLVKKNKLQSNTKITNLKVNPYSTDKQIPASKTIKSSLNENAIKNKEKDKSSTLKLNNLKINIRPKSVIDFSKEKNVLKKSNFSISSNPQSRSLSPSINSIHSKASKIINTYSKLRKDSELLSKKLFSSFKKDNSKTDLGLSNNSKSYNTSKDKEIKINPIRRNLFKIEIQNSVKDSNIIKEDQEFNLKPTTRRINMKDNNINKIQDKKTKMRQDMYKTKKVNYLKEKK